MENSMKNTISLTSRYFLKITLLVFTLPFLVSGCAKSIRPSKLETISIGMEKSEVINRLGKPSILRGSLINTFGQEIEVLEYKINRNTFWSALATPPDLNIEEYWLYFYNNKLVQWCKAGHWTKEATHISITRFK
jgi:hypothetical protein